MPYFGTTTFAAPGLSIIASAIIFIFGMWWLGRAAAAARKAGEGYVGEAEPAPLINEMIREQAAPAGDFDPAELPHGKRAEVGPSFGLAVLPLVVVIATNFLMSLVVFPRLDFSFLSEPEWGGTTIGAVSGVWSVIVALAAANLTVILVNFRRLPSPRESLDAGANSAALPMLMIASLVGFGAVVAALPAFAMVRDAVFSVQGGPLVSLSLAMNVLAGLTGTASGGMAIVLNAFGSDFMRLATEHRIDPELMHRITTMSAGTLDALPHNGTVLLLLQISGLTHRESYLDMVMTVIVSCIIALIAVLILGSVFGSF
jgi:H+/gluconate symporter-like permease